MILEIHNNITKLINNSNELLKFLIVSISIENIDIN